MSLKPNTGWLDSSLLPFNSKNCTFRFSTNIDNQYNQSPGVLIKVLRLNVPCGRSGGYLQFNRNISMCGKLEEFPESRRTLYLKSYGNTSLSTYNYPKFHFVYKLVDYCYNITLLERNSSFVIQPTNLALKCHFKIHLPFGNRIRLKLRLNGDIGKRKQEFIEREISMKRLEKSSERKINYSDIHLDDFPLASDAAFSEEISSACVGILIEIGDRMNGKWNECVQQTEVGKSNIALTLTSSDNVLLIRITKSPQKDVMNSSISNSTKASQKSKHDERSSISLEYSAVPIETLVSQCAFGWILVGQVCLSTSNEILSWDDAESYCNNLGGHLASIRSDYEQQLVDEMLLNR